MEHYSSYKELFASRLIHYAAVFFMTIVVLSAGALQLVTVFSA